MNKWWITTAVIVVIGLSVFLSGDFILGTLVFAGLVVTEILMRKT